MQRCIDADDNAPETLRDLFQDPDWRSTSKERPAGTPEHPMALAIVGCALGGAALDLLRLRALCGLLFLGLPLQDRGDDPVTVREHLDAPQVDLRQ